MDQEAKPQKAYFFKELVSNPVNLSNGKTVRWEPCGDDEGILATANEWLIGEFRKLSTKRVGGIIEIDEEAYDAKKNSGGPARLPRPRLTDQPRWPQVRPDSRGTEVPVAEANLATHQVKPKAAEHVDAPLAAPPPDPGSNRPTPKKFPKVAKPTESQPSIMP